MTRLTSVRQIGAQHLYNNAMFFSNTSGNTEQALALCRCISGHEVSKIACWVPNI